VEQAECAAAAEYAILSVPARGAIHPRLETKSMSEELKNPAALEAGMKDADVPARSRNKRKKKVSILTTQKIYEVDYKDTALLRKFVNDRGKMLSSRQTGTTARQQRVIAQAVKRAREMALLTFIGEPMNLERREPGAPRPPREPRNVEAAAPAAEAPSAE
jgi:small subunit ribosomal protein S18